jgi:hypothetical protein
LLVEEIIEREGSVMVVVVGMDDERHWDSWGPEIDCAVQ